MSKDRTLRIGAAILEIAVGVFLVVILLGAWKTPESQASSTSFSKTKKVRTATTTAGSLLPLQGGTLCMQDDSNPGNVVLFEPANGNYIFCCNGVVAASGTGTSMVKGNLITIQHFATGWRVLIKADTSTQRGTAALQQPPGVIKCTITDRNMTNNTCECPAAAG